MHKSAKTALIDDHRLQTYVHSLEEYDVTGNGVVYKKGARVDVFCGVQWEKLRAKVWGIHSMSEHKFAEQDQFNNAILEALMEWTIYTRGG